MDAQSFGIPTFLTRVERWQCDFNDHWNARFYARSFQMAAETTAGLDGRDNVGGAVIDERHMRFHRELLIGNVVEVRSARLRGSPDDGRVVHCLLGDGRLSAIALDRPGTGADKLPDVEADSLARLLPRRIEQISTTPWPAGAGGVMLAELGPVRPYELDHAGMLLFEELIARTAVTSHALMASFGYTMEFSEKSGVGRMAAELGVRHADPAPAGTLVTIRSRLASVAERSFTIGHRIETKAGGLIAAVRQTLLSVDLRSRRTVAVPDFMHGKAGG